METLIIEFNNREIALFVWVIVFLIGILKRKSLRKPIAKLFLAFIDHKILTGFLFMIIYVELVVLLLVKLGFWDFSLLKDTIYWTFGVGFIFYVNMNKPTQEQGFFKRVLLSNLKFVLIIVFVTNLYVFSLMIELIVIPIVLFTSISSVFTESKKEYKQVKQLMDFILSVYGISVFSFSAFNIASDFGAFVNVDNLRSFLLGPIFTILYLPFIYFAAVYMVYEVFYQRLNWDFKADKKFAKVVKWQVFFICRFNLAKIKIVSNELKSFSITNKRDFKEGLKTIL